MFPTFDASLILSVSPASDVTPYSDFNRKIHDLSGETSAAAALITLSTPQVRDQHLIVTDNASSDESQEFFDANEYTEGMEYGSSNDDEKISREFEGNMDSDTSSRPKRKLNCDWDDAFESKKEKKYEDDLNFVGYFNLTIMNFSAEVQIWSGKREFTVVVTKTKHRAAFLVDHRDKLLPKMNDLSIVSCIIRANTVGTKCIIHYYWAINNFNCLLYRLYNVV